MRLVFDTETSGLLKPDLPTSDPAQPHMCQLGAILLDAKWKPINKVVVLIKPDGWSMEREAEAHHGISEARCARYGVPVVVALAMLQALVAMAMQTIAHNKEFDRGVIDAELARLGADAGWWYRKASTMACTMETATAPCAIPGKFGFKFPTIAEALARFDPANPYISRHDAEEDMMATARLAMHLDRDGLLPAATLRPRPPTLDLSWRPGAR